MRPQTDGRPAPKTVLNMSDEWARQMRKTNGSISNLGREQTRSASRSSQKNQQKKLPSESQTVGRKALFLTGLAKAKSFISPVAKQAR